MAEDFGTFAGTNLRPKQQQASPVNFGSLYPYCLCNEGVAEEATAFLPMFRCGVTTLTADHFSVISDHLMDINIYVITHYYNLIKATYRYWTFTGHFLSFLII